MAVMMMMMIVLTILIIHSGPSQSYLPDTFDLLSYLSW